MSTITSYIKSAIMAGKQYSYTIVALWWLSNQSRGKYFSITIFLYSLLQSTISQTYLKLTLSEIQSVKQTMPYELKQHHLIKIRLDTFFLILLFLVLRLATLPTAPSSSIAEVHIYERVSRNHGAALSSLELTTLEEV